MPVAMNAIPGNIAIQFGLQGPNFATASACASANHAIGCALESIRRGECDVVVTGGAEAALMVAKRVRLFARATSLGGVESLIEHRATVEGEDSPFPDDLLRLSIGIEDADDLIADLEQALAARS